MGNAGSSEVGLFFRSLNPSQSDDWRGASLSTASIARWQLACFFLRFSPPRPLSFLSPDERMWRKREKRDLKGGREGGGESTQRGTAGGERQKCKREDLDPTQGFSPHHIPRHGEGGGESIPPLAAAHSGTVQGAHTASQDSAFSHSQGTPTEVERPSPSLSRSVCWSRDVKAKQEGRSPQEGEEGERGIDEGRGGAGGGEWRGPSAPYASDAEAVPYSSEQEAFRRLRHSPGCVRKGSAPARGRETPREGGGGSGWRRGDIGWWWKGISLSRPRPWPALVSLTQGQSKRLQQEVSSPSPSGSLGPKRGGRWWSLLLLLRSKLSSDLFVFWAMMWTGPLVSSLVAGEIRSESHSRRRPQSGSSSLFAKLTHFFVDLFLLFLSSPSLLP